MLFGRYNSHHKSNLLPFEGDANDEVGLAGDGDGVEGVEEAGEEDNIQYIIYNI